jgi:hypothetical protein
MLLGRLTALPAAPREDLSESCDVAIFDEGFAAASLIAKTADHLRPYDVQLAVKESAAHGQLTFFFRQSLSQSLEFLVTVSLDVDQTFERTLIHVIPAFAIAVL